MKARLQAGRGLLCTLMLLLAGSAMAQSPGRGKAPDSVLAARLLQVSEAGLIVTSDAGKPEAFAVSRDGEIAGYIASTSQTVRSTGYSGRPIDILVAVGMDARITGAELIAQSEPILTIGITDEDLAEHVAGYSGIDLKTLVSPRAPGSGPDAISGASHSSAVIRDGIIRTARIVAHSRGLLGERAGAGIDRTSFTARSWPELLAEGAVTHRQVSVSDVRAVLGEDVYAAAEVAADALFADLHLALATPPTIGQNLIGKRDFDRLSASIGPADNLIFIASSGLYSFKGTAWRRSGVFDRIELVQGRRTIRLTDEGYFNVTRLGADGAPEFREAGMFVVPEVSGFDPAGPFRVSLLAAGIPGAGAVTSTAFDLTYQLVSGYIDASPEAAWSAGAEEPPAWVSAWETRIPEIALVVIILMVLSAILVFQDVVARNLTAYRAIRLSFLTVTIVGLGWILGAQLSVVHVFAFAHSIVSGFQWETFLLDPLIFILWSFVAVALLFWGRGVFCGWLCPFGALQELINEAARALKIRQITVPFGLQERLWPIKYIIFLGLFAVSLGSIRQAFVLAEVEPFKTAITLWFAREWPFVLYVLALLAAGLFIERFYCRYLCPLGAALAIPARLRMFDWLKRRHQCGRECRICATRCTVGAIHPDGHINPNECIHCLNCQTLYHDRNTCPVLKARERRRAPAAAAPAAAPGIAAGAEGGQ